MTTTQPEMLQRNSGRIAYEVEGTGPLVVCIPGMGDLRSTYRFNVPSLVGAGFRVATMDLRGHGDSDATFTSYDDEATADDVTALVEHLGGPAVLVGNSMGAGAAAIVAGTRPELVSGLVLVGPFVRDPKLNPVLAAAFRLAMAGPWAARVWTSYLPKLYPTRPPLDFSEHVAAIAESMRRPGHLKAFRQTTRTTHAPAEAALPSIASPTLVVMGDRDPDFTDPLVEARWISERLHAELLAVQGSGHYPHAEFSDVVNPRLVAFVERAAARA
jgi:pimeloyl-ACP methyl ester carboxylesterase